MPNGDKDDRALEAIVTPTLIWRADGGIGASVAYAQGTSNPNMPNRVRPNGDLKMTGLQENAKFTDNVDVTFSLDTSKMVDQSGNPVPGRWATATEYSGQGPVTGFAWLCNIPDHSKPAYDPTPISVPGMTTVRVSDTQVMIDDNTDDAAPDYGYCLGLVLDRPGLAPYYITLDPRIGSKGSSGINR